MLATFSSECRRWRRLKNLSQLDLALIADISQKHLSYIENGKSQPSRAMVIKLSEALEIPLRDRNRLLQLAGFSAGYRERQLSDTEMAPISFAIETLLAHHEPFPAMALDKKWNLVKQNGASQKLLDSIVEYAPHIAQLLQQSPVNMLNITIHPQGLRPYIVNWADIALMMRRRLEQELLTTTDEQEHIRIHSHIQYLRQEDLHAAGQDTDLLPVIPLILKLGPVKLSLFSVITTFGTPQDITTDEIRIECFYPMDDATEAFFNR